MVQTNKDEIVNDLKQAIMFTIYALRSEGSHAH